MKKMTKIAALLLVAVLVCSLLPACGQDANPTTAAPTLSATAKYTVTVVDLLGNPMSNVGVKFFQNGDQVGMSMTGDTGVASKELDRGQYTVVLSFTDVEHVYYYDEAAAVLTETTTDLEIAVAYKMGDSTKELYVEEEIFHAYEVDEGCTYVNLANTGRNYFLFTPERAGVYAFSLMGMEAQIGYYGTPFFIYAETAAEVVDGVFTITIEQSMIGVNGTGTTQLVIGVDSDKADVNGYLCINWLEEPPKALEWESYPSSYKPSKYTLPEGLTIHEFDLAAETYELVYNEQDQYYHLNSADGPIVLVRLLSENPYSGFAFGNILLGSNVGAHHYDENGELINKILYNDCLQQYLGEITGTGEDKKFTGGMCDDTYGVYPLTKDLETILKDYGTYKGTWDSTSPEFMLGGVIGLNPENGWLMYCCYAQ